MEKREREVFTPEEKGDKYFRILVENSPEAIVSTDEENCITFFNPVAEALFGYKAAEVMGKFIGNLYQGGKREAQRLIREIVDNGGKVDHFETQIKAKGKILIPVLISASQLKNAEGKGIGVVKYIRDITKIKDIEKELRELSITDDLTGLYNQRHFYRELGREMERALRFGYPLCLLLFDLDKFKAYNDIHGHPVGDELLRKVGKAISASIRKQSMDSAFRYGGDEFAIILPKTTKSEGIIVGERIRDSIVRETSSETTISVGLVEMNLGWGLEKFVEYADGAMYTAKQAGGNRIYVKEKINI